MIIHKLLDRVFPKREIVNCEKDVYLHRWYVIRTSVFGLFIHKFVRSDEDRALHDHPWSFIVIPIWRGYWEHSAEFGGLEVQSRGKFRVKNVNVRKRVLPILGTRYRPAEYAHRVELIEKEYSYSRYMEATYGKANYMEPLPAWSIFIRFRKRRDWGFLLHTGWIPWNKWWQDSTWRTTKTV